MTLDSKIKEITNKYKVEILTEHAKLNTKYTDLAVNELVKEYNKYIGKKIEYLDFKNLVVERLIINTSVFEFSVSVTFHCINYTKKGTINKNIPSVRIGLEYSHHLIKFID